MPKTNVLLRPVAPYIAGGPGAFCTAGGHFAPPVLLSQKSRSDKMTI